MAVDFNATGGDIGASSAIKAVSKKVNPMMVAGMIGIAGSAALGIYGVVTANKQRRNTLMSM